MLNKFLSIFKKEKDQNVGICREKSKDIYEFYKFTKDTKDGIEDFIGHNFDFDFNDTGVLIWLDCSKNIYFKSYYIPYNTYILKREAELRFTPYATFSEMYDIINNT